MDIAVFKTLALSFPGTSEAPHFDKIAFRTTKRIFATLDTAAQTVCLKLSPIEQSVFCAIDATIIYPVNNKWGQQGWTVADLKKVRKSILKDALSKAYEGSLTLVGTPKKNK